MRTIVVTGGAGFVGSCLALGVKHHHPDARVIAFDNLKRRGSELNLPRLRTGGVEFVHGDIRNKEDLDAVGAVEVILECSAEPSVLAGYTSSPEYLVNTNLLGAINCFELARRHGAATIFLSTSRVYPVAAINALSVDETETRFVLRDRQELTGVSSCGIAEGFPLEGTRSLYGATKLCGEYLLREYLEMYGLKGVINRCGVITGPWQMGKVDQGVVVLWAARHVFGGPLSYIGYGGQGKQVRDMVHVDDILRLVLAQMARMDDWTGRTFNVGGGVDVSASLRELTEACRAATGKTIAIGSALEDRPADIRLYITDNTYITHTTGWRPERTVPMIVEDIVRWIRDHEDTLRPILG